MFVMIRYLCIVALLVVIGKTDGRRKTWKEDAFKKDFMDCHNSMRAKHHVPPLSYTRTLNKYAQNFADKLAASDSFYHSGGPYGENLYYSTGLVNGDSACNAWYGEIQDYDFARDNPVNFMKVGHFTQLIWKDSKHLGVGKATSNTGKTIIVASYDPPGNYRNMYHLNVFQQ